MQACKIDNVQAIFELGRIYENNEIERNLPKAVELYQRASDLGHTVAMNNLALLYDSGRGNELEKDCQKTVKLLEKAIQLGNPNAMHNLAQLYLNGRESIEKNISKAFEILEKLCESDNNSLFTLARLYETGKDGLGKNVEKSVLYFYKSFQHSKDDYTYQIIRQLIQQNKVEWKKEYHCFWENNNHLNQKILNLLLINKNRHYSKFKILSGIFVKGICFKLIKYLAQIEKD